MDLLFFPFIIVRPQKRKTLIKKEQLIKGLFMYSHMNKINNKNFQLCSIENVCRSGIFQNLYNND